VLERSNGCLEVHARAVGRTITIPVIADGYPQLRSRLAGWCAIESAAPTLLISLGTLIATVVMLACFGATIAVRDVRIALPAGAVLSVGVLAWYLYAMPRAALAGIRPAAIRFSAGVILAAPVGRLLLYLTYRR
jgi:hypothetical protein